MTSRTYGLTLNTMAISIGEDFTTGIDGVTADNDGLTVRTASGVLYMSSNQPTKVVVYSLDGKAVWTGTVGNGEQSVRLPQGVYIVNNQKVAL